MSHNSQKPKTDDVELLVRQRTAELLQSNDALRDEVERWRQENQGLVRRLHDVVMGTEAQREIRRAALNLMEDAVAARLAEQRENTERRRVEQRLHEAALRATSELEQRVQERTTQLSETVQRLQEEIARRTAAEHDLRHRTEQLRALAGEVTLVEQRERRRLARILHDHLQQLLVAAKLRVASLGSEGDSHTRADADKIENLLAESLATCRTLTAELSPPILHEEGLSAGLQWLVLYMADKHELTIELIDEKNIPSLP